METCPVETQLISLWQKSAQWALGRVKNGLKPNIFVFILVLFHLCSKWLDDLMVFQLDHALYFLVCFSVVKTEEQNLSVSLNFIRLVQISQWLRNFTRCFHFGRKFFRKVTLFALTHVIVAMSFIPRGKKFTNGWFGIIMGNSCATELRGVFWFRLTSISVIAVFKSVVPYSAFCNYAAWGQGIKQ